METEANGVCLCFIVLAIDGYWGDWAAWGSCSQSCGTSGYRLRSRACDNPAPQNGGRPCSGADSEMSPCFSPCAVNGHWGSWSAVKLCSVTCGNGTEEYTRSCDNPAPVHGGKRCRGPSLKQSPCSTAPCEIDGDWGTWSHWSVCSVSCGNGTKHRNRHCDHPSPSHGGRACSGYHKETQPCHHDACPVNGGWSQWSAWGQCSVSCGDGVRHRTRTCTNPTPSNGGLNCIGANLDSHRCHNNPCPVNGGWSQWSAWGNCSVSCGGGVKRRARTCTNPAPSHGGHNRTGTNQESQSCHHKSCCHDNLPHNTCLAIAIKHQCKNAVGWLECRKTCRHCH